MTRTVTDLRSPVSGLLAGLAVAWLCLSGAHAAAPARFDIDRAPLWIVADTLACRTPVPTTWNRNQSYIDGRWLRPLDDLLALRTGHPAADLNAVDEVPASSWYTPRREPPRITSPEMRRFVEGMDGSSMRHGAPLEVLEARLQGPEPYLLVREGAGARFWIEFDDPGAPELKIAAACIASRLLAAAGYNVFLYSIDVVSPDELALAADAREIGEFGGHAALARSDLESFLARRMGSGNLVKVAAAAVPDGTLLGGFRERGVRPGDPNDRIPHEDRRSLRGLRVLAAWLDYSGIREDRTLDIHETAGGYVRHYLRTFSSALGNGRITGSADPEIPVVVRVAEAFSSRRCDLLQWQPTDPWAPFAAAQWADLAWGVRCLLSIPEEEVRGAVAAGVYGDQEVEAYIAGTLLERRERIARAWLGRFHGIGGCNTREVSAGRWALECSDLALLSGLRQPEDVYCGMTLRLPDTGEVLGLQSRAGDHLAFDLTSFIPPRWLHRHDPRRYAIAELQAWEYTGHALAGRMRVHLYFDRDSGPRVVGIERD